MLRNLFAVTIAIASVLIVATSAFAWTNYENYLSPTDYTFIVVTEFFQGEVILDPYINDTENWEGNPGGWAGFIELDEVNGFCVEYQSPSTLSTWGYAGYYDATDNVYYYYPNDNAGPYPPILICSPVYVNQQTYYPNEDMYDPSAEAATYMYVDMGGEHLTQAYSASWTQ